MSSKVKVIFEQLEPILEKKEKVVIFSQFTSFMNIICTNFKM